MDYFTFHLHGKQVAEASTQGATSWVTIRSKIGAVHMPADNAVHAKAIAAAINGDRSAVPQQVATVLRAAE